MTIASALAVVAAAAGGFGLAVLRRNIVGVSLSPDGKKYSGDYMAAPRPFCLRWLVPALCGSSLPRWKWLSAGALGACAGLCALIVTLHGMGWQRALFAGALFVGLSGMFQVNSRYPVLIDAPAFALMLAAVAAEHAGLTAVAVAVAIVGAMVKETVPVFAALATMNPWLLLGLIPVAVAWSITRENETHPRKWETQKVKLLDARIMVFPWGAALLALWAPTPAMLLSLAVGYGLLGYTSDTTRVYQWAAAPMIVGATALCPEAWLLPVAVAHIFSPFVGDIW